MDLVTEMKRLTDLVAVLEERLVRLERSQCGNVQQERIGLLSRRISRESFSHVREDNRASAKPTVLERRVLKEK